MASSGLAERSPRAGAADALVLETSLTPPALRPEHIERPRLLSSLLEGPRRRLTLVAAPPGFGKSTLLASWVATLGGRAAWLSLEEADDDPARFVAGLVAALRRVEPGIGEGSMAALRGPAADVIGVVVPNLLNDLARVERDVVLVVEDYHLIHEPAVHRAMALLVERSPATLRVALSTREDPPLPLGRLRARGELAEIRADDLRFADDEAERFLTGALGLALSPHDVATLQERTEGWPAAMYLAALTLRGRGDAGDVIARFAGDDRFIVDYLTTEVLARQRPELRSFLLRTSILRRFSAGLCDAVMGIADSAARIAELERSNLLVVPLDNRREWYRYHHLFGDLLRRELDASEAATVPELHRRASAWYRDAGLVVDAAAHAVAAGDLAAVAELIGRSYALFLERGQLATVVGWLERIPDAMPARDWLLGFAGAVVYANAGRLEDAERWLALGESAPAIARDGQEPASLLPAIAGTLRLLRGDIGGAIRHERLALEGVPDDAGWAFAPRMVLASALWWSGEMREAEAILEAATRVAVRDDVPVDVVYALGVRAAIALEREDERAARELVGEALDRLHKAGLEEHAWTAMAQVVHGTLAARTGDLRGGAEEIGHGLALGERLRAWQVMVAACLALAEVRHRQGDAIAARRLLARTRDILEALPDPGDGFARLERTEKLLRLRAPRRSSEATSAFWELSPREMEVLRLLPGTLSQREMAAELYVSFNTLRTHTRVIFSKLGVTSRSEAVARARELGLI